MDVSQLMWESTLIQFLIQLRMAELTDLDSRCSQEPPDGLHSASSIEVVKLGLPRHGFSKNEQTNEWMNERDHRSKMYSMVFTQTEEWSICLPHGGAGEVPRRSPSLHILTQWRPSVWNCTTWVSGCHSPHSEGTISRLDPTQVKGALKPEDFRLWREEEKGAESPLTLTAMLHWFKLNWGWVLTWLSPKPFTFSAQKRMPLPLLC